jgi:ribosomal protein S18 acetylase RimI-like enzyme
MPPSKDSVRDVSANELTGCLTWLLGKMRVERAQWVVALLTDRVERKRVSDIFAVESRQDGRIAAAAIAIAQPPHAANLVAIGDLGGWTSETAAEDTLEFQVFARLRERLNGSGVKFLQAATESTSQGKPLERLGFVHLADLAFLVLESEHFLPSIRDNDRALKFHVVGQNEGRLAMACEIAALTFTGTLDCPRLSHFRSAEEIVAGYRSATSFDPELWHLVMRDDEVAGCLFLTQHRGSNGTPAEAATHQAGAMEISYMGIVPKHRGVGLGERILVEASRIASQRQAHRMVLAVDRENSPAMALYQRRGWVEAACESVWGCRILP